MIGEASKNNSSEGVVSLEASREAVEQRPRAVEKASVERAPAKTAQQREFMREREVTIAQIRKQVAEAQAEQADLLKTIGDVEAVVASHETALSNLNKGVFGWLTNRNEIQRHRFELAGDSERLDQLRKKLVNAKRYEAGMAAHLSNLLRKHEADQAALAEEVSVAAK